MKSLFAMCMAVVFALTGLAQIAQAQPQQAVKPESAKLVATRQVMRNLWTDHIFWVRAAVVAKHDKNTDAEKVAEAQIVANAHQIADAIIPFYGKEASEKLFGLLAGHWGAIKDYLNATDADDSAAAQKATQALFANAKTISEFLSGANPAWPFATVQQILTVHAAHHITQIQDIYKGDYQHEAENWAQMRQHMDVLGDALGNGLAAQFPDKF